MYDIGVRVPPGVVIDDRRHANVRSTFEGLLSGDVEPDGFNRLVLFAGLTAAQANLLRCYAKYANQIGFTFSQGYIQDTMARLPQLATLLVELFEARFDPDLDSGDRIAALAVADSEVLAALDAVPSLDDDRIGRMFLALIRATVRTSAYQGKPTIAFKFDPGAHPRPAAAAAAARDLRVLVAGRGRPPPRRRDRPRWAAMERSARGLSHRGARPGQGPDGEERGDRAGRGQGRVRRQAAEADAGRACATRGSSAIACSCAGCST